MVSPGVIAGLAVIDASVIGQAIYAIRSYERHHQPSGDGEGAPPPAAATEAHPGS